MPELPEVETARSAIAAAALNRRIVDVDDHDSYECRPHLPGEIRRALVGRTLTSANRRGKSMWCATSGTDHAAAPGPILGLHLGMAGRIFVVRADSTIVEGGDPIVGSHGELKPEWDRFTLFFADGGSLRLFDKRRLGRVRLNPPIERLGPDALEISAAQFRSLMRSGTAQVKARLLDQTALAGVGNLLADEALWQARLSPAKRVDQLQPAEVDRLHRAVRRAVNAAVANGGAHTGRMISERHPGGHCPRCHAEMRHGTVGGRSTWWCSAEQSL
ncbi:DNA-formamidopyrimidine glycosylase family protein [Jatrophihabitans sp. DSM 45814]